MGPFRCPDLVVSSNSALSLSLCDSLHFRRIRDPPKVHVPQFQSIVIKIITFFFYSALLSKGGYTSSPPPWAAAVESTSKASDAGQGAEGGEVEPTVFEGVLARAGPAWASVSGAMVGAMRGPVGGTASCPVSLAEGESGA